MQQNLIACHDCDLLQRALPLDRRAITRCRRCFAELYRPRSENLDRTLAFTLAAAILFMLANAFPIVGLELQGRTTAATLFGMAQALWQQNMKPLAVLVFFTTEIVPAVQLTAMAYLLIPLRLGRVPSKLPLALRALQAVRPWGMIEVFLLGVLVAIIKLSSMAQVIPGPALWAFGGLTVLLTAVLSFNPRTFWEMAFEPRAGQRE